MVTTFRRVDPIEVLGLSRSTFRRLRRGEIVTVGDLLDVYSRGQLSKIQGIGVGAVDEIEKQLARLELSDLQTTDLASPEFVKSLVQDLEAMRWEVRQRIEQGILDERASVGNIELYKLLNAVDEKGSAEVWEALGKVIPFHSISDELQELLGLLSREELIVLVSRYTLPQSPLKEVASELSKSMETVARIEKDIPAKVKALYGFSVPGVYIQTALRSAEAEELELDYIAWLRALQDKKLLSLATLPGLGDLLWVDEASLMLAVCEILSPSLAGFRIPSNLRQAIDLFYRGSEMPLRVEALFSSLNYSQKQSIFRYLRHLGAVSSSYLANVFSLGLEDIRSLLLMMGFMVLDDDWYVSEDYDLHYAAYADMFHRYLLKVFSYCGMLSIGAVLDLMGFIVNQGIYPVPPAEVMVKALRYYGYSELQDGYWSYPKDYVVGTVPANEAEKVILSCFSSWLLIPRVYLVEAVYKSGLHPQYAYIALRSSPLFVEVGDSLFGLRGVVVSLGDIAQAQKDFANYESWDSSQP